MKTFLGLLASAAVSATLAVPAQAAIYSTTFSGSVISQQGTSYSVGGAISGSFTYSSDTGNFLSFNIGSYSATSPYVSSVTTSPGAVTNPVGAFFTAQNSSVQTGGNNQELALDLEAATNFSSGNALTILTTPGLLSQLDTTLSEFTYYSGTSAGTGVTSVSASISAINTSVSEPASRMLLAAPMLGLAFLRR